MLVLIAQGVSVQGVYVLGGKCLGGKCPGGIIMSQGVHVLGGKCPGGKCPGGKCPGGICPWGKCPGGTCPGGLCPRTLGRITPNLCITYSNMLVSKDTKICVTPNANVKNLPYPQQQPLNFSRWPCTFHLFCVDFIRVGSRFFSGIWALNFDVSVF